MARLHLEPQREAFLEFEHVSLAMPRKRRRGGGGRQHRLRRLAGESRRELEPVLTDINVTIRAGESVAILGVPNGGINEFMRLAVGTLVPDEGVVHRNQVVIPMLHGSRALSGRLTVRQNIYLVGALLGMGRDEVTAKLPAILEATGIGAKSLDDFLRKAPTLVRQRLVWAVTMASEGRAFAIENTLVVGQGQVQARCWAQLEEARAQGKTFVVASERGDQLLRFCDRAIVILDGQVRAQTSVAEGLAMLPVVTRKARPQREDDDDDDDDDRDDEF